MLSRIAGLHATGAEARDDTVRAMLAAMLPAGAAPDPANLRLLRAGNAVLGSLGPAGSSAEACGLLAVLDGQAYNVRELAADLDLKDPSPARLLAALAARHGFAGALGRMNGDFACAVYDPATDTLHLGRDRFGVKPLYHAVRGQGLAFASRPRALLAPLGRAARPDPVYVAVFAGSHYRYIDNRPERSPYQGVDQLCAGHALRHGRDMAVEPYWRLTPAPLLEEPEEAVAERVRDLLLDSCRLRLDAAANPIFTLSGGMDSSSVLACCARLRGAGQPAISTVYQDKTYDESDDIATTLEACASSWTPVRVDDPDVFALVREMVAAHDEPVATATWLAHHLLCREAAAKGADGVFGGLGGDELFAGEYEYFFYFFADLRRSGQEELLVREVRNWIEHHDHPVFRKSPQLVEDMFARCVDFSRPGRNLPLRSRLAGYARALAPGLLDLEGFAPAMDHPFASHLLNRTFQDLGRETTPCCLRAQDRQAAAFGLEHLSPFLDHRLAELMFRVPGTMKIRRGVTKHILRQAVAGILPEATRTRVAKTGWNAPAHVWFTGRGLEAVRDLAASRAFAERGVYDPAAVRRIIDEHAAIVASGEPRENHMMFLWQLVNLELWLAGLAE